MGQYLSKERLGRHDLLVDRDTNALIMFCKSDKLPRDPDTYEPKVAVNCAALRQFLAMEWPDEKFLWLYHSQAPLNRRVAADLVPMGSLRRLPAANPDDDFFLVGNQDIRGNPPALADVPEPDDEADEADTQDDEDWRPTKEDIDRLLENAKGYAAKGGSYARDDFKRKVGREAREGIRYTIDVDYGPKGAGHYCGEIT